jgi:hypothetical protein
VFFIFFGLVAMLVQLLVEATSVLRTIAQEQSVRAICDASTHKAPELALLEDDRYHLFLSRAPARTFCDAAHSTHHCSVWCLHPLP